MNHEGHEDHEIKRHPFSMRIHSPLSQEAEHAMTETIGCAIAVHRALGPGFLESIYKKAMHIEMRARGLSYESEKAVTVEYRGIQIEGQRVDLVVEGLVVVELKAETTGLRGGLLINFRVPVLKAGLRRIVL